MSSTNLDELANRTLPGLEQQLEYLVRWLASKLGDDPLGRTALLASESLAGIIGVPDGTRVERLIDYAAKDGLVERDAGNMLGLTPKGWHIVKPVRQATVERSSSTPAVAAVEILKAHCNTCGGERKAFRRTSYRAEGSDDETSWSDTYDVLECCGCGSFTVRHALWFSEWDEFDQDPITGQPRIVPGIEVKYWPPPTKRKKPEWADQLSDDVLRLVIDEVYQALNSGLIVLASIGTRTLLDRAMFLRVGDLKGGFTGKLKEMAERGHIGTEEKDTLEAITDAGSAAAHRGFAPDAKILGTIVATVENFLHREFVLKTAAGEVRAATPPRR